MVQLKQIESATEEEKQTAKDWQQVEEIIRGNPYREAVKQEMYKMSRDEKERYLYLREEMAVSDEVSRMRTAIKEGIKAVSYTHLDVTFIHCSMNDEEQLEKCKYIISTVELNTDKPYVQVNPLLMEVDVQKIRTLLRKNPSINKTNFSMQTVKVFHEQIDKIQILQEMSNYLRMCGAVTPRFFEGVLKRENMGSTEVGDGIILTHGSVSYTHLSGI